MAKTKDAAANAAEQTENWDEAEQAAAPAEPRVKVKCIVHTFPGTGGHENPDEAAAHRGMAHGEVRELPESIANAMLDAGHVRVAK